ncbi:Aconitate hydratase 1 [gamma proteobacterium HdN1]|nr:Aconitate hydratase 1 [gamma proteobacterium HdN1]
MLKKSKNSFNCVKTLTAGGKTFHYYSLAEVAKQLGSEINQLPFSLKVLLENLLRHEDDLHTKRADIEAMAEWNKTRHSTHEIGYQPARVLMQDFTGVPAVVDLATMRDAIAAAGGDPSRINPHVPVDLVIDHSVMVDKFGTPTAFSENVAIEYQRNRERYQFLRWGQKAFKNFRVVPPGTGICHQVNLEYLGKTVWQDTDADGKTWAYPDTLVGTDSHTTMINGLGVLGWGVGGIEAEAAMLGQPISMLIPEVIGLRFSGKLKEGVTATDLVLTVTELLRKEKVVGKFVEYFGEGIKDLAVADRATLGNMSPEYGATCGFFPVDERTLEYMRLTGREEETIELVEQYAKAQGLWHDPAKVANYTKVLELDLGTVVPSLAGPKRPQDRVALSDIKTTMLKILKEQGKDQQPAQSIVVDGQSCEISSGDVIIAAITSCTNTSNPSVMLAAGLLAKKAVEKGLKRKPWVKTSLAPGSKVVTDYLKATGLQTYMDALGYHLVGYGCTTCIGNSGPLPEAVENAVIKGDLTVGSVLSGNRNFEGRIHPNSRTNWLASPPLVVAYALLGTMNKDITTEPLGQGTDGPVYLKDIWPSSKEIQAAMVSVTSESFRKEYADVFSGDEAWRSLPVKDSQTYDWDQHSTYIRRAPFFDGLTKTLPSVDPIKGARILALFGDSITTDHISPASNIKADSPAGHYLQGHGIVPKDFNSYGARRGNHEVMMRGTFANIRIRNEMTPEVEGGFSRHYPENVVHPLYGVAMRYLQEGVPSVVIAGKEYGTGSSRDWAAKGTILQGIRVVLAESFERIHRSNLVGMGVLPLQFPEGETRKTLGLTGEETVDVPELGSNLKPGQIIRVVFHGPKGTKELKAISRLDTEAEIAYYKNSGILHYVLRSMM